MDQKSLEIKTVNQLKDICRQDPQRYHGFSKNSRKADLIKFIIHRTTTQAPGLSQTWGTNGQTRQTRYGIPVNPNASSINTRSTRRRTRPVPTNLRSNPVNVVYQSSEDDYNEIMNEMFDDNDTGGYYTDYELDEEDKMFNGRFSDDEISEFISIKEKEIKSWNNQNSVVFDSYSNFDKDMMYSHYKKQYFRKNGRLEGENWNTPRLSNIQEMILFHGTDKQNISEILEYDFALTIGEKHGHMFGRGIYFTNDLKKAISYSEKNSNEKYLIVVQVHIGDICTGKINMDIHPKIPDSEKRYDTSVDHLNNPVQFIKKSNNQYNILGVLKINIVSYNQPKLVNKFQIINNSNKLIKVYWLKGGISIINSKMAASSWKKHIGSVNPKSTSISWLTSLGHEFICTTPYGIVKHIIISKKNQTITISDDF
tara:strand:- start:503 stop:1777 length:1275 start_codon:yes stop_codon:yes gene_type:complete